MKNISNGLIVFFALLFSFVVAEGVTRSIDGLPLFSDYLPNTVDRDVSAAHLDTIARAEGVSRAWFFTDPVPLSNRRAVPADWVRIAREIGEAPDWMNTAFRPADYFKAWNSEFARDPCKNSLLRQAPGHLYTHRSLDGSSLPRFRFLPDATTPLGLVTNQLGWRGPPFEIPKPEKRVRIVFVGASTTVNSHYFPFSYPEFVGHWLNQWASARKLDLRFEALNAGREGMVSTDIEAIVRKEVLPLRPDLVVYYEGENQFEMKPMLLSAPPGGPSRPRQTATESLPRRWLRDATHRLALARRFQAALGLVGNPGNGEEWPKPRYDLMWPAGLSEDDPDIVRPDLPVNLSLILADLDRIRAALAQSNAELVLSSYKRLARHGMILDPVRDKMLIERLNIAHFPFSYSDIARLSTFQNRVLAKYASQHGLAFIDVAGLVPDAPDLFTDAVHMSYGGVRLHGWVVLQELVRLIERRLAHASWPEPVAPGMATAHEVLFTPGEIVFDCKG